MRANVLSIWSPDVDVAAYRPQDPSDDGFLLTIYAGPSDGPGHESFDLTVCTPSWLARRVREVGRPLVGRHYLIVESMDIEVVLTFLRKQVHRGANLERGRGEGRPIGPLGIRGLPPVTVRRPQMAASAFRSGGC
jgi:hypothetical protein